MDDDPKVERLVDFIKREMDGLKKRCEDLGMTDKTIDRFFKGEEIQFCVYCCTLNMYESHYNKKTDISTYKCNFCHETYKKHWTWDED